MRAEKQTPLLEVENLKVDFQLENQVVQAVKGISYQLMPGEILGIVGESGSGKSVSSYGIMGLLPINGRITEGNIWYKGKNLAHMTDAQINGIRGKEISMIFQDPMTSLDPVFTIGYQIEEILKAHTSINRRQRKQRVCELLNMVGITNPEKRRRQYPHELSGGMRQRVMIAMAIACNPKIVIADEPTTALDVTIQAQILQLLYHLKEQLHMSMIFITHDFSVVARISDRIAVMQDGKIVEIGDTSQILKTPKSDYTKKLLDAIPRIYKEEPKRKLQSPVLLDVQCLQMTYEKKWTALDDISFRIYKGEVFGLVGESGCGKSTLGKTLLRLEKADSGKILFHGEDLCRKSIKEIHGIRKKMQMVFQDPYASLNPSLTVGENIREGLQIHKIGENTWDQKQIVYQLLKKVGLKEEHAKRYPCEFSGGQRQRIGIARALAVNPEFMIWDESVSALDVSIQKQILQLIEELHREHQLTYLFISHDLAVVKKVSDRIGVMYAGQLVEVSDADTLFQNPLHPYTKLLLSAILEVEENDIFKNRQRQLSSDDPSSSSRGKGCVFHLRCPSATTQCRYQRPSFEKYDENHMVACFHWNR